MDRIHQVDLGLVVVSLPWFEASGYLLPGGTNNIVEDFRGLHLLVGHRHDFEVLAIRGVIQSKKAAACGGPTFTGFQLDFEMTLTASDRRVDAIVHLLLLKPRPKRFPAALLGLEPIQMGKTPFRR